MVSKAAELLGGLFDGGADREAGPAAGVVALAALIDADGLGVDDPTEPDEELLDPDAVPTCPTCGGWQMWQDGGGAWRCQRCEPEGLALSHRWADRAERIRQRTRKG